ncbi:MAG: tetratricopeptide repeat protein [Verrucomicrobiia bacterium]
MRGLIRDPSNMMKEPCKSVWLGGALVVLAALAAYSNSFSVPFLFDDVRILKNPRIQHAPLTEMVASTSRPVVQLSLALNYAVGGFDVRGYHAFNLIIHMLAALTLYGIVRRTLAGERLRSRYGQTAGWLAFAVALVWLLHPLQTESVTYIIQRAESMMGLFYLLTLYCVIRGAEVTKGRLWYAAAVVACAVGMRCKPVMATVPVVILLYDRAFLTGSLREALRRRVWLYSSLAATWLLLLVLLQNGGQEWKTNAGFAYQPIQPVEYALTQPGVILHYLRLSVWPHPLCLDYAWPIARTWISIVPPATLITILLFATVWLWKSMPSLGFVGAWFFLTLAPSSSVVPIAEAAFEHRMYLPLAAVVTLVVIGIHTLIGWRSMAVCLAVAVGLGFLTVRRNADYRSELAIWSDTAAKRPSNPRAHNNLGVALASQGRVSEAIAEYSAALRIKPNYVDPHNGLGAALASQGKVSEAIAEYAAAVRLRPDDADAHYNFGIALVRQGNMSEAIEQFEQALRLGSDDADVHNNLGVVLARTGRLQEAIRQFYLVLRIKPDDAEAHYNLGNALLDSGKVPESIKQYEQVLHLDPDSTEAHYNLGDALYQLGNVSEAIAQYREALRLMPDLAPALSKLAWILATDGNANFRSAGEAVQLAERLCAVTAGDPQADALDVLAAAYAEAGRFTDAVRTAQKAMDLAAATGQQELARQVQERLRLYQTGRAFHEKPLSVRH